MTKKTYKNALKKKQVREFLFSKFNFGHIIGLAGPDINDYIKWCESKGYKEIEIWENDQNVMVDQLSVLKQKVSYRFGDILESEVKKNVLYDLDYCATIKFMKEHLQKFKENFIMTFSLRFSEKATIKKFFRDRKEKIINVLELKTPLKHSIFITEKSRYIYIKYHDTSTMCCFAKIK